MTRTSLILSLSYFAYNKKMRVFVNNEVLDLGPNEVPSYSRYFDGQHDDIQKSRYKSLANLHEVYLLLPDYERVRVCVESFLVHPISVAKVDSGMTRPIVFSPHMAMLVKPHVRRDGLFELRGLEVEGSYVPSSRDNVSCWDTDKPFRDEYLSRPLKRLKEGDSVFVVPSFRKYQVLGELEDSTGVRLVSEMEPLDDPVEVAFESLRVLQSFEHKDGSRSKVLLRPDPRGVSA